MSKFEAAFEKLSSLTNYERLKPDPTYRLDLSGMKALCAALGHPDEKLGKVVQVAGSKGKGSVSAMLSAMGRHTAWKVGTYMSPHVRDVMERVQWNGSPVAREAFASALHAATENMIDGQTWFEVFTAAAVEHFASCQPDLCVLEVGLGGRLDSTSAVRKDACCITQIELEHTQILGDDLASIAREKAGIFRAGVPCVTGCQGVALDAVREEAQRIGVPLFVLGEDFSAEIIERNASGMLVSICGICGGTHRLQTPFHARVQARNLALALKLMELVDSKRTVRFLDTAGASWMKPAALPGRFQILDDKMPIIIDGSHTNDSLATLAEDVRASFPGRRFRLVFGVASGKHWRDGLGCLLPLVDSACVAPLQGKPSEVSRLLFDFCRESGVACQEYASITDAVLASLRSQDDLGMLVTGSLYAAGEALCALDPTQS